MPIRYTTEMMDTLYASTDGTPIYRRAILQNRIEYPQRADWIAPLLRPGPVLIIGCALGLLNEELDARGWEVYGIDNGDFLDDLPDGEMTKLPFMQTDLFWTAGNLRDMKNFWGWPNFENVITEDVAPSFSSDEIPAFIRAVEQYAPHRIHFTSINDKPRPERLGNFQPLDYWRQHAPTHTWIGTNGIYRLGTPP